MWGPVQHKTYADMNNSISIAVWH